VLPLQPRRADSTALDLSATTGGSLVGGDISQLTLHEILAGQLAASDDEDVRAAEESPEEEEGEEEPDDDLQPWISRIIRSRGCDVSEQERQRVYLHFLRDLAAGHVASDAGAECIVGLARLVLEKGGLALQSAIASDRDDVGDTLLLRTRHMLVRGLTEEAAALAEVLCLLGPDVAGVNVVNAQGRTLLSYAVAQADGALALTRVLLNHGGRVWPGREAVAEEDDGTDLINRLTREREQSAFTWFLRAAMTRCAAASGRWASPLEGAEETVLLLATTMGEEPARMRRHVTRTLLQLGRGAALNGPLFLELKLRLAPWWERPQPLRHQCARRVRRSLGPARLNDSAALGVLRLPPKLRRLVARRDEPSSETAPEATRFVPTPPPSPR